MGSLNTYSGSVRPRIFGKKIVQLALMLFGVFALAAGCGGGGSSAGTPPPPTGSADTGELLIGITDAEGDFVSYSIDVTSLTLTNRSGDVVETLPLTTRIDFTELTEVTEFLTIATVPAGIYESATIGLDFASAEIVVQDELGETFMAEARDAEGNPLAQTQLRLTLADSDVIRIRPGAPAAFSLDFDLDASNEIDFTASPVQVTVEPFLLATPELEIDRRHRVRGVLKQVDQSESEFTLAVRPFRHRSGQFGRLSVAVTEDTQYDIDGTAYTGAGGLEVLAALPEDTPVVTAGQLTAQNLVAREVIAGTSVPWSNADVVRGVVHARDGQTLQLSGSHIEYSDGRHAYRGVFAVELSDATTVSAPGLDDLTSQSISVGQRIVVWGEFVDDTTVLAERVRMRLNQLTATVVQADPLAVDLLYLNGRRPGVFDFSGTGVTAEDDADPSFYEVATQTLGLQSIAPADLVRVRGYVNEFGAAPADYLARTVIDVNTDVRAAYLKLAWPDGSNAPFTSIDPERIEIDLEGVRKSLHLRGVPRDFIDELTSVVLATPASGRGIYAVKVRGAGEAHTFRSFVDLVDELIAQLDAGRTLYRVNAQGIYNIADATLTTHRAGFIFRQLSEE